MSLFVRICVAAALVAIPHSASAQAAFRLVALGDMPYGEPDTVYGKYRTLIRAINARSPDLVIHIGDIKSASTSCSDQRLTDQLNFMNSFQAPVLYTPGDNEWTDCHREKAGNFDPLDRLAFLRNTFYGNGSRTLGAAPQPVERQSELMPQFSTFVENTRLAKNGVHIVAAHVVGSNNNFEIRDPKAAQEFFDRNKANIAWLNDSFAKAEREDAKAVIVAIHADMFKFGFNTTGGKKFLRHSGFAEFGTALANNAKDFGKPVLLIYGDSHVFQITRPFGKAAPNLVALEVYGAADMHAVEVLIDPDDPAVFAFRSVLNPALAN